MDRIILEAENGFIYTDGNIYGTIIYLASGANAYGFYQIPIAEYEA
jgi:hypothetical protein